MVNDKWPVGNGEWPMTNGQWGMANGKWRKKMGKYRMSIGIWQMTIAEPANMANKAMTMIARIEFFIEDGNVDGCDKHRDDDNLSGISEDGNDRNDERGSDD